MRSITPILLLTVLAAPAALAQHPLELDELLGKLRGGDERARAEARILLPRLGVGAAPALFEALADPRPEVWWAAYAVIADGCNAASVAGRKTEQRAWGRHVLALLAPEQSDHLKTQGLRLLPQAAPDGFDLAPAAHLLRDPNHRERARQALQETGTPSARALLRDALADADPVFEAALCLALGQLRDAEALPLMAPRLRNADPAVRAAAAWGVAWAGRVADHPELVAVYRAADAATVPDAGDALLAHTDAVAANGGNWNLAMAAYRLMLREARHDAHRGAALTGLARFGDETVVPDLVAAVSGPEGASLRGPVAAALASMRGRAARRAVAAAYPDLPVEMRAATLGLLAATGDPLYQPLLASEAESPDPGTRDAALEGLAAAGAPEAVDALARALAGAGGERRARLLGWLRDLAEAAARRGDAPAAGRAHLALYRHAPEAAARAAALEGVKRFPTPEAYEVLLETTPPRERAALPADVIAGTARALHETGRAAEAAEFVALLWARAGDRAVVEALRGLDAAVGGAYGVEAKLGFFGPWRIAGPFGWSREAGFQTPALPVDRIEAGATYAGKHGAVGWGGPHAAHGGLVDLSGVVGNEQDATAFAAATVRVAAAAEAELRLGSDDGVRAWVNGAEVHRNDTDRGAAIDQDVAPVRLRAGENLIVLEISQNAGGWNFIARLTGPGGAPLAFEKVDP